MQPLEYTHIGSEEHLSFDSIRLFVFRQLSNPGEKEARQHLGDCYRCRSIYESLANPDEVRKNNSNRSIGTKLFGGILLVMATVVLAVSYIYFGDTLLSWSLLKIKNAEITVLTPNPPEVEPTDSFKRIAAAPELKSIDTRARVPGKQDFGSTSGDIKRFDSYTGTVEGQGRTRLKGIYGEITANGEPLKGVTIMVPAGRTAKVSDSNGKYYIQVPSGTPSLLFIYRGKQLVKELDPTSRRHDVHLKLENIMYPEIESPETGSENIVSN